MAIESGQTLLHYRLVEQIGAGGMGVVWKAKDTTLGRDVAIKILPEAFAADDERLVRFEREARLLASLNHPHIAGIYGIHEAPATGSGQAGIRFLAMELVSGEDLAAALERGPLPLARTLQIMQQVAVALEAAHDSGIVHRDLKPANVRLTHDGQVKVLDFGLAKAYDPAMASDPRRSMTVTSAGTVAGLILGTAAYMSPEQASGQPTDRRADIWSFGVMLHEMLTHKRLFDGETISHTLADVLRAPIDLDTLPAGTPPALRRLLERCLDRDRRRRLRDIGEARIALEDLLAHHGAADASPSAAPMATNRTAGYLPWIVAALAGILAVVGFTWRSGAAPTTPEPTRRFAIEMPNRGSTWGGTGQAVAISSDGRFIVTVGDEGTDDIFFIRSIDDFEAKPVAGTTGAGYPFVSPDDRWIGFIRNTQLHKVRVGGGAPVFLGSIGTQPSSLHWARDGQIYYSLKGRLHRISAEGGEPEPLGGPEIAGQALAFPFVLPGERAVLCNTSAAPGVPGRLQAFDLKTGKLKDLDMAGTNPRYLPTGHVLFAQSENVVVAAFDVAALAFTGSPVAVHPRAWVDQGQIQLAVSEEGTVAYMPITRGEGQSLVVVDLDGKVEPLLPDGLPFNSQIDPRISRDGRQMLLSVDSGAIYMIDLDTQTPTLMSESGFYAQWSPDGSEIIFGSTRASSIDLYRRPVDLSSPEQLYLDTKNDLRSGDWSRQGILVVREEVPGKGMDLHVITNIDDPTLVPLLTGPDDELAPIVSPDGKWLAYVSNYSGDDEVYVTSFPQPGARLKVSTKGGNSPTWAPDGSALYYFESDTLIALAIETTPRFRVTGRKPLFAGDYIQYRWSRQYDIFPDGKRFVLIKQHKRGKVEVATNWFAELRDSSN